MEDKPKSAEPFKKIPVAFREYISKLSNAQLRVWFCYQLRSGPDDVAWLSRNRLATESGLSDDYAVKARNDLVRMGLMVEQSPQPRREGGKFSTGQKFKVLTKVQENRSGKTPERQRTKRRNIPRERRDAHGKFAPAADRSGKTPERENTGATGNGSGEIPEDGSGEIPEDGSGEIPEDGSGEIPEGSRSEGLDTVVDTNPLTPTPSPQGEGVVTQQEARSPDQELARFVLRLKDDVQTASFYARHLRFNSWHDLRDGYYNFGADKNVVIAHGLKPEVFKKYYRRFIATFRTVTGREVTFVLVPDSATARDDESNEKVLVEKKKEEEQNQNQNLPTKRQTGSHTDAYRHQADKAELTKLINQIAHLAHTKQMGPHRTTEARCQERRLELERQKPVIAAMAKQQAWS
jgi:hypothetical protein